MTQKQTNKYEKESNAIAIGILIIFLMFISFGVGYYYSENFTKRNIIFSMTDGNIDFTPDQLQEKCGSTQLAKEYGSNDWSVFVKTCKGEYCKHDYVKLKDCLK